MQEPFDWEQAMETTRRSATAASQNSENSVAGMSKLLREIDRHSIKIASLTETIDQLAYKQEQQVAALGLLAVFAVGVVFGGFIVN